MRNLKGSLAGVSILGMDTSPIIYFIEAHPRYDDLVTQVFEWIHAGSLLGVTSVIGLAEVLALPLRQGDAVLQKQYRDLLLQSEHFQTIAIDAGLAERAADLRARYQLRTPDALQIAAALHSGCQAFLTNDGGLKRVTDLDILVLDELEL